MVAIGSPRPCRSLTIHLQLTSPQLPRLVYSGYSTYRIVCYSLGLDISREAWPDLLQTRHQSPDIVFPLKHQVVGYTPSASNSSLTLHLRHTDSPITSRHLHNSLFITVSWLLEGDITTFETCWSVAVCYILWLALVRHNSCQNNPALVIKDSQVRAKIIFSELILAAHYLFPKNTSIQLVRTFLSCLLLSVLVCSSSIGLFPKDLTIVPTYYLQAMLLPFPR